MTGGVKLEEGSVAARSARLVEEEGGTMIELTLTEGKKRQIRRMFAALGLAVTLLRRTRIGNVTLGDLEPGMWRPLRRDEVRGLRRLVERSYLSLLGRIRLEEDRCDN